MANISIQHRTTLADHKYLLECVSYRQPNLSGDMDDKQAEVYHRPDAAALLLYDNDREVFLFARQFRLPAYLNNADHGYLTEVCAGLIDEGETPEQTVIREAEEELGYQVDQITPCGRVYSSAGGITEMVYLFAASYTKSNKTGEGGGAEGEQENITLQEISYAEIWEMLNNKEIIDAKTLMLLQHFFLFIHS